VPGNGKAVEALCAAFSEFHVEIVDLFDFVVSE
jgi:hypothetical protein